jgi:hypothetical protein
MRLLISLLLLGSFLNPSAQFCNVDGNLAIYSNYDGGLLQINVDMDIPDLYIGVASYEFSRIEISGAFASNVAGVWYAGYDADNDHCDLGTPLNTTISGVTTPNISIEFLPTANLMEDGLPTYIIYNYQCDSNPSSGNSPEQLAAYFSQMGTSTLLLHQTQYGCWSGTQNISDGGNCCLDATVDIPGCIDPLACNYDPGANVDDGSCTYGGLMVGCTDPTACNYDPAALTDNGYCHHLCYGCLLTIACNYDPNATTDDGSCDFSCLGCTYEDAVNYNASATRDDGSCIYSCAPDLDNNGLVATEDLLIFLSWFGLPCD